MCEHTSSPGRRYYRMLLVIFVPFALGHFLSFFFRSVTAVLTPHLVADVPLGVGEIGLLSSAYFLAFGIAQLPVGLGLDRFGPKRIQIALLGVAAVGTLLFALANSFLTLFLGRVLIGIGLSACFMAGVKAISTSFERHKIPSLNGGLIAVGGLGAMASTIPVEWALDVMNWRTLFFTLAAFALVILATIALVVPNGNEPTHFQTENSFAAFEEVWRNPAFRSTISLVLIPHTVAFGVQGLWLGQWLHDIGNLDRVATANALLISMGGIVAGSLSVGAIGEWASKRGIALIDIASIGVALFIVVQLAAMLNFAPLVPFLAVAFTFVGTIGGIEYAIVSQAVPRHLTGRASTLLNLLIFFGSFLVQTMFGLILSRWTPMMDLRYPPVAYTVAFGVLVSLQLPGLVVWYRRRNVGRLVTDLAE